MSVFYFYVKIFMCERFCAKLLAIPLIVFSIPCGCGPRAIGVYPVTGKVFYNGEPLAGATVAFQPTFPEGRFAVAETLADGTFSLFTPGAVKSGAPHGDYIVRIGKLRRVDRFGKPFSEAAAADPKEPVVPKMESILPAKYDREGGSVLRVTVKKTRNSFQFDLDDAPEE